VWNFFKKKYPTPPLFKTDIHSHLLPNLDDGVSSFEEAVLIIELFQDAGFTKAITTPHIMNDYYRNTSDGIKQKADELRKILLQKNIHFDIQFAAEYYFDESLISLVSGGSEMLTFGDKYLLFETNTFAEPMSLNEFIFQLKVNGYKPVLAHPERYRYLHNNYNRIEDLVDRGVLLQVNALSLTGFYSRPIQVAANKLVDMKMVHFLGSDCHNLKHAQLLKKAIGNKYFTKALNLPLMNYSI